MSEPRARKPELPLHRPEPSPAPTHPVLRSRPPLCLRDPRALSSHLTCILWAAVSGAPRTECVLAPGLCRTIYANTRNSKYVKPSLASFLTLFIKRGQRRLAKIRYLRPYRWETAEQEPATQFLIPKPGCRGPSAPRVGSGRGRLHSVHLLTPVHTRSSSGDRTVLTTSFLRVGVCPFLVYPRVSCKM